MSKVDIMNKMTRSFNKVGFKFKKHSPEILVVTGIVGAVTSGVMACRATLKVNDILEESKEEIEKIREAGEKLADGKELKLSDGTVYTTEDNKKDLAIVYAQAGMKLVKLYAPSVILGALSITSILKGHNILRKRNIALAAAYTAVDKGFKEYRSRVVERFGKELDKELRYNIKAQEVEEIVTDKDGNEQVVKTIVNVPEVQYSDYAKIFDQSCDGWSKSAELNMMFLKRQQDYANDRLRRKGHLFLNEVYDMLGIQRTIAGNTVGWIYDEKNPTGDNYVDFGIVNINSEANRRFVNGLEYNVILDFNVDGDILHSGAFEM